MMSPLDRYHYSGFPRDVTSYPVYDGPRGDRGFDRPPRYGGGPRDYPRRDPYMPGGRGGR